MKRRRKLTKLGNEDKKQPLAENHHMHEEKNKNGISFSLKIGVIIINAQMKFLERDEIEGGGKER